jgi:hypothetical protein
LLKLNAGLKVGGVVALTITNIPEERRNSAAIVVPHIKVRRLLFTFIFLLPDPKSSQLFVFYYTIFWDSPKMATNSKENTERVETNHFVFVISYSFRILEQVFMDKEKNFVA